MVCIHYVTRFQFPVKNVEQHSAEKPHVLNLCFIVMDKGTALRSNIVLYPQSNPFGLESRARRKTDHLFSHYNIPAGVC